MKKKLMAGVMSIMLIGAAVMPVSAADPEDQTASMQVNVEVGSTFTLSIPSESTTNIELNATKTQLKDSLKVTGNVDTDEQIRVTATTNPLKNTSSPDEVIDYRLTNGTVDFTEAVWNEAELRAGLNDAKGQKEIPLYIEISQDEWNKAKSGSYTGNITFVASLEKVTNS